jgi:hypothetical protein
MNGFGVTTLGPKVKKPTRAQLRNQQDAGPAAVAQQQQNRPPANTTPALFEEQPREKRLRYGIVDSESLVTAVGPDTVSRREEVAVLRLSDVASFFERRVQDFQSVYGVRLSKAATPPFIVLFTGDRDSTNVDIRAGSFDVRENPEAQPDAIARAVERNDRVALWRFQCVRYKLDGFVCGCYSTGERMTIL